MCLHWLQGVHRRRWRHAHRSPAVFEDLFRRQLTAPNRLWVTNIIQHRTDQGWVYCAAVIDVYSRRCVGWSIADHLRTELVVDALDMARWQRKPAGTVVHSNRCSQYTSWLFGTRMPCASGCGETRRLSSFPCTG